MKSKLAEVDNIKPTTSELLVMVLMILRWLLGYSVNK